MSIITPIAAAGTIIVALSSVPAYAFDNADDCINEKTFECLDDDDFWGCYDFIVEGCNDQVYELVLPPSGATGFTSKGGGATAPKGPQRLALARAS